MWLIDGHQQVYFVENDKIWYVDTGCMQMFYVNRSFSEFKGWFRDNADAGETLNHMITGDSVL